MKHASADTLQAIEPFLQQVRLEILRHPALREPKPGIFYLRARAFLHFHEDPKGLFADLRVADEWTRFTVNTPRQQSLLLGRIRRALGSNARRL